MSGNLGSDQHRPVECRIERLVVNDVGHANAQGEQPLMDEKKRDKDRRNADRHEPFVAKVAGRMEDQPFLR